MKRLEAENEDLRRRLVALERLTDENYRLKRYQEETEVFTLFQAWFQIRRPFSWSKTQYFCPSCCVRNYKKSNEMGENYITLSYSLHVCRPSDLVIQSDKVVWFSIYSFDLTNLGFQDP